MSQATRLFQICRRLSRGAKVTVQKLEQELEVSRATVFRDIELLRSQLNAPIVWDATDETYRYERHGSTSPAFEVPGLWMEADQLYGMLTVLNIASAIDPGIAHRYRDEFGRALKEAMSTRSIKGYGLDQKIAVDLPRPSTAAQAAMRQIAPALMLDRPVRIFGERLGEHEGLLVVPTRMCLTAHGWRLEYRDAHDNAPGSVLLDEIVGAQADTD